MSISFGKLLLIAFIVWVVWAIVRYRRRVRMLSQVLREARRQAEEAHRGASPQTPVSLEKCPVCGAYVPPDAAPCGREDCPFGRR